MFLLKVIIFFAVYEIIQLLNAESVLAWGPGVHTAIALNSLNSASLILPSIARVITSFPVEYMYGSLSADFFIGKGRKKKSGKPHDWESGFRFLSTVTDDREAAYALGFLSHLAADVIAHNFFIPNLMSVYPSKGKMGHLFWEIKSDYLIGPGYTSIAKGLLDMDHQACDDILKIVAGERRNVLKTKKQFYTRTIRVSDYLYTARSLFFVRKTPLGRPFHKYLALMVDLSCRLANDFLKHPESSPCLSHDPMGKRNLLLAKRRMAFSRVLRTPRPVRRFDLDEELLYL